MIKIIKSFFASLFIFTAVTIAYGDGSLVGSIEGDLSVDDSGHIRYSLPIKLPQAAKGFNPSLAIGYTQGSGNSVLGLGFDISGTSSITRCSKNIKLDDIMEGVRFDENSDYCLDGERLVEVASGEYRLNSSKQVKIIRNGSISSPESWTVWGADGFIKEYGTSDDSMVTSPRGSMSWGISVVKDRLGNETTYSYSKTNNNIQLDAIEYQQYKVNFIYESRLDKLMAYMFGESSTQENRLQSIEVYSNDNLFYNYKIGYIPIDKTKNYTRYSKVKDITYCDKDGKCLQPISFDYATNPKAGLRENKTYTTTDELLNYSAIDINRDGHNDICYYDGSLKCAIGKGDGSFEQATKWTSALDTIYDDKNKEEQEKRSAISASLTFFDINGDRQVDYCAVTPKGVICGVNDKNGHFIDDKIRTTNFTIEDAYRFTDINNDLQVDICAFKNDGLHCSTNNKGEFSTPFVVSTTNTGLAVQREYTIKSPIRSTNLVTNLGTQIDTNTTKIPQPQQIDIDGDGYQDICGFTEKDNNFYCSLGQGFDKNKMPIFSPLKEWGKNFPIGRPSQTITGTTIFKSTSRYAPVRTVKVSFSQFSPDLKLDERFNHTFRFADINSDGLQDVCYRNNDVYECRVNTGASFEEPKTWIALDPTVWKSSTTRDDWAITNQENSIMIEDMDSDSVPDFVAVIGGDGLWAAHNSDGAFNDFKFISKILPDLGVIEKNKKIYTTPLKKWFGLKTEFRTAVVSMAFGPIKTVNDLDTKPNKEICYRSATGLNCLVTEEEPLALLKGVTSSLGLKTTIEYDNMLNAGIYTPRNDATMPLEDYSPNLFAVTSLTTDDGIGGKNKLSYKYEGFKIDGKWGGLGFSKISVINEAKNTTSVTEYHREASMLNGLPKSIQTYVGDHLISSKDSFYELVNNGISKLAQPRIIETLEKKYDIDGKELYTKTTTTSNYNEFQQPQNITEKISDIAGLNTLSITNTQYLNNLSTWIMGKPIDIQVTHNAQGSNGSISKHTTFGYDDRGMLIKEVIEPDNTKASIIEYTLDDDERSTTISDKNDNSRTTVETLDEFGRVVEIENELGHTAKIIYDDYCSLPKTQIDANGLEVTFEYDGLCRKIKETSPTGLSTDYFYEWSDGIDMGLDIQKVGISNNDTSRYMVTSRNSIGQYSRVYYDALDRKVKEVGLGIPINGIPTEIYKEYIYDQKGQLAAQSIPHKKGSFAGDGIEWMQNKYDELGRTIEQIQPIANKKTLTTQISYDGFKTTILSSNNHKKESYTNAKGQLLKVIENDGSKVEYKYDAIGNQIETIANGKSSYIEYDIFGRKVSQNDISLGKWNYEYNAFGELVSQTDAKGVVATIVYDKLGRVVEKSQGSNTATFIYDNSANGIGKLSSSTNSNVEKTYTYDDIGRVETTTQEIDDQELVTQYGYDIANRVKEIVYPSGIKMNYGYTISGQLEKVTTPKTDLLSEDFSGLEDSLKETFLSIKNLEEQADKAEENVFYYKEKYELYRRLAEEYKTKGDSLQTEIDELETLKNEINSAVNQNQKIADDYREKSIVYKKLFGNTVLHYIRTVAGNHYYNNTDCTKSNWKGHCKEKNDYHVYIPEWMIEDVEYCTDNSLFKSTNIISTKPMPELKVTCTLSPEKNINTSELFAKWADIYQAAAIEEDANKTTKIAAIDENITAKTSDLSEIKALETYNRNEAEKYLILAKEESEVLLNITNELNKQLEAQQKIEDQLTALQQNDSDVLIWAATSRDVSGQIDGEIFGNGLTSTRTYEIDGTVSRIKTGYGDKLIQDLRYTYDDRFNPLSKEELISNTKENYTYDNMDRLVNWSYQRVGIAPVASNTTTQANVIDPLGGSTTTIDPTITSLVTSSIPTTQIDQTTPLSLSQQYRYDIDGNMIYKSNMGDMAYNIKNQLVSSGNDDGYTYDANGNMLIGNGKKYDYNEFNKVSKLTSDGNTEEFTYDESDNLVKKVTNGDVTTYYGDAGYELTITKKPIGVDDEKVMKHNITIEGRTVAIHERTTRGDNQSDKTAYVHSDAQGSVSLVTDNSRAISFRNEFTPFGEDIENLSGNGSFDKNMNRGYTGHRMISSAKVINMNARIYDPAIARFTSPDTVVPDTTVPMAHNRYIYVYNNPIKYVDPDGHCPICAFIIGAIIFTIGATSDNSVIHSVGTIVGSLMMMYGAGVFNVSSAGISMSTNGATVVMGSFNVGFTTGYIGSGGNMGEALKGGMFSALGAAVAFEIGHVIPWEGSENVVMAKMALAHGVSQGAISELRGGDFKSGFIGGFLGKMTGGLGKSLFEGNRVAQYIAVTMIGGAVSEAAGGDFLDGAISAAMVHLFNDYAFKVNPNEASGNGHTTLYFQDKNGQWYAYNQGAAGETSSGGNYGFLLGLDAKAGVSIEKIDEPSDYNVKFDTSSEQDYKIYRSAISSQTEYNRGKIYYNIYSDSCTDAAVDVINNANIGVTVQNPIFTIKPNSWVKGF